MPDIYKIICVERRREYVTGIKGTIKREPDKEPAVETIFSEDGEDNIRLKHGDEMIPVVIKKVTQTRSGKSLGEPNIPCFFAKNPQDASRNLLDDLSECEDY